MSGGFACVVCYVVNDSCGFINTAKENCYRDDVKYYDVESKSQGILHRQEGAVAESWICDYVIKCIRTTCPRRLKKPVKERKSACLAVPVTWPLN